MQVIDVQVYRAGAKYRVGAEQVRDAGGAGAGAGAEVQVQVQVQVQSGAEVHKCTNAEMQRCRDAGAEM